MPINVTPFSGLSDRIDDVRSHNGRGAGGRIVTNESLRDGSRSLLVHILVARDVIHTNEKNESWGSDG
jgi:hypothetical protein